MAEQSTDPLHGITLKTILEQLVAYYGWEELEKRIRINCFSINPSINSSLKFLRKTPWARAKVEELYVSYSVLSKADLQK
ncbi:MAG: VF530 family protein [Paludibacter sp.]